MTESYRIYLMSKKRLLAIIVWSTALAATGAIADVIHLWMPKIEAWPRSAMQRKQQFIACSSNFAR